MKRKPHPIFLLFLAIVVVISLPTFTAHADIAPPANPPGANIQPGDLTQVRMVAETVLLDISSGSGTNPLGRAKVTATFTMRNLGSETERMAARFPVGASDGYGSIPEITDFTVTVNGSRVGTRKTTGEDPNYGFGSTRWAEFDITFPPGEDVIVVVTYTLQATGYYPIAYFSYILSTGADWQGTIGSADIIARFPYEISPQNVIFPESQVGWMDTTQGATINGSELRWHYDDLEPTQKNNILINIVSPDAWNKVLTEQANVEKNPNDGEAWGRLAMNYKKVSMTSKGYLRGDAGGEELYRLSVQAYEKCLALLPNDALWHAGYAELLHAHNIWQIVDQAEALRAVQEIHRALELSPNDPKIIEIAESMIWGMEPLLQQNEDGTFDFLWLTATPTPQVEPTATDVPPTATLTPISATATVTPSDEATMAVPPTTAAPTETPKSTSPLCGSAALAPLALVALVFARRKPTHKE